jgi:hypothetical protein
MNDGSVFTKLIDDSAEKRQPEPEKIPNGPLKPVVPPADYGSPPIEKLLDWLVNRWPKDTVKTVDILQYGPALLRNRKKARPAAEILVERGWLTPLKTRCFREHEWRIERGPQQSK